MLQIVEVQCPHCGARGQIMVPPLGGIVFGPCPQCKEPLVVFCGKCLLLDKDTMEKGNLDKKREHMFKVLSKFLDERLTEIFAQEGEDEDLYSSSFDDDGEEDELEEPFVHEEDDGQGQLHERMMRKHGDSDQSESSPAPNTGQITEQEIKDFGLVELKLMDDPGYFNSVFGRNPKDEGQS